MFNPKYVIYSYRDIDDVLSWLADVFKVHFLIGSKFSNIIL